MSDYLVKSLGWELKCLAEYLARSTPWPSPDTGFVHHVFTDRPPDSPLVLSPISSDVLDRRRIDQAPMLAAAGYGLALLHGEDDLKSTWSDGLSRLSRRDAFPIDRASFFFRPVDLLGIALGATSCSTVKKDDLNWLRGVIRDGEQRVARTDIWAFLLGAYAAHILSVQWSPIHSMAAVDLPLEDLALIKWLRDAKPDFTAGFLPEIRDLEKALLMRCSKAPLVCSDAPRSAILYRSLASAIDAFILSSWERNWQVGRNEKDAVQLVRSICARFHICASQLACRHDQRPTIAIRDEYDVQDIMHALLKLHFDDVRPEEWTPSYAGNSSRMDFLLKREKLVVETKMTRDNLNQKKVADELIIDKGKYRKHPDCRTLVCFVYDPEARCTNPTALETDLSEDQPEFRVVVVVAPKGM